MAKMNKYLHFLFGRNPKLQIQPVLSIEIKMKISSWEYRKLSRFLKWQRIVKELHKNSTLQSIQTLIKIAKTNLFRTTLTRHWKIDAFNSFDIL